MKKRIVMSVVIILLVVGIGKGFQYLNFEIVNHKDVGSYINVDELDLDKVTMLHFYGGEITVHSESKEPISFVKFGLKSPLNMYINKSIVIQNHMENYALYTDQNYIKYSILEKDYINHDAVTLIDIVPSDKNENVTFFAGDDVKITNLIIFKNTVTIVVYALLIIGLIIGAITNYNNKWFLGYILGFCLLFIDFSATIILLSTLIYFINGSILDKKYRIPSIVVMVLMGVFIAPNYMYIVALLLLLLCKDYLNQTYKPVITMLVLGLLLAINAYDYEFRVFTIFYKELHLVPFIIYTFLMSYKGRSQGDDRIGVDLLREINHDFKIPLSVLKLNNEMLYSNDFETEAKRNSLLNSSSDAINTLQNMLSSINAFLSKSSYVSKEYNTSVIGCIEKTQDIFSRYDKKIEFIVQCDTEDTILHIDEIWLNRLIFNLLDNAYKYTEDYGTVTLTYKKEKSHMLIIIEDTGIGMTREDAKKVTTPFYRADKSRSISGLGLGLSIVKNIIDKLRGELSIESSVGVGTMIVVKI